MTTSVQRSSAAAATPGTVGGGQGRALGEKERKSNRIEYQLMILKNEEDEDLIFYMMSLMSLGERRIVAAGSVTSTAL